MANPAGRYAYLLSTGGAVLPNGEGTTIKSDFGSESNGHSSDLGRMRIASGYGKAYAFAVSNEVRPNLHGVFRAGAFRWHARHEFDGDDLGTMRGTEFFVGSGARWQFNDSIAMTVSWDWYRVESYRTHLGVVGVMGQFGAR